MTAAKTLSTKGRATRQALEDAARTLFAQRGFHGTTLADITSAAGKSTAAFYRYFSDKEDLLAVLAEDFLDEVVDLPAVQRDGDFFAAAVGVYWNMFKPNIGIHRAFLSRDFLARLSLSQAQELTRAMYQSLERAFREFDIPPAIYQNALMTSSSQVRWLTEAETRSLGTYPAWFDEYLLARCDRLQVPEVTRDATASTREKSACAMRVIQDHRRQVRPAPPTAQPPAAD